MKTLTAAALAAALLTAGPTWADAHMEGAKPSPTLVAAVAAPGRPASDKARDAARKPAQVLAFAGVKPGDKVADFIIGGGYYTRILTGAVGPSGKVYAYQPAEFIQFNPKYGEDLETVASAHANVVPVNASMTAIGFAEPLDMIFTAQNYHDFHLKQVPAGAAAMINKAMFDALKPGGTLLIIDHHAAPGSGVSAADTLHRIDVEAVKAEVTAAGFVLDGESDVLAQPSDPRTGLVFPLRDKTDQFTLKFRKPA